MEELLSFLHELQDNNNREWFHANKERYLRVQAYWNKLCTDLLSEIAQFEPWAAQLTLRDTTYRIYRDTRFSADKSPYKTHFGTFIAPGGKCSMHSGYYFHIGVGGQSDYTPQHMLATGNYCYDKQVLQILREDISDDWEAFQRDVLSGVDKRFGLMLDGALKRVPREYPADAPYADWMRMRMFGMEMTMGDEFLFQPDLVKRVAELFRTTKPLNDFINRAIDFVREEE